MSCGRDGVTYPGIILPGAIYRKEQFFEISGLGRTTASQEAERGNILPQFRIGRCVYVRGDDAIEWMNRIGVEEILV